MASDKEEILGAIAEVSEDLDTLDNRIAVLESQIVGNEEANATLSEIKVAMNSLRNKAESSAHPVAKTDEQPMKEEGGEVEA